MTIRQCVFNAFLGLLTACSSLQTEEGTVWESELYDDHPLTGSIWRSHDRQLISLGEFFQDMQQYRVVLLGEKHDNPDHHRLQREVLTTLQQARVLGSVSFEMLGSDQQALLDSAGNTVDISSDASLQAHLQWDSEGWDWKYYGPLLKDMLSAGVPVRAGNISRDEMMAVYQGELAAEIEGALDTVQMARLNQEIDESHCGMLPASQFPAMVRVQQARDAQMAKSLSEASEGGLRVLIAGNFHARHDLGVPNYIPADSGGVMALGFMEVDPEMTDPQDYMQAFSATAPYDYLWFTPAVSSEDYCAAMRASASN